MLSVESCLMHYVFHEIIVKSNEKTCSKIRLYDH